MKPKTIANKQSITEVWQGQKKLFNKAENICK